MVMAQRARRAALASCHPPSVTPAPVVEGKEESCAHRSQPGLCAEDSPSPAASSRSPHAAVHPSDVVSAPNSATNRKGKGVDRSSRVRSRSEAAPRSRKAPPTKKPSLSHRRSTTNWRNVINDDDDYVPSR